MSTDFINLDTAEGQVPDYMRDIASAMTDSTTLQRKAISHVQDVLNGQVLITDSTNPFTTLMGVSSATAASLTLANLNGLRRRYAKLATTPQELYPHMSDSDYIGRFATPVSRKVRCLVNLSELRTRSILQPDGSRIARIPRYSTLTVDGVTFTLLYPVVIKERSYGGWVAYYDLDEINELLPLTSSSLYPVVSKFPNGADFFGVELDMLQVMVLPTMFDINPAVGVDRTLTFTDQYCYARVWFKGRNQTDWQEMHVTHDAMVYDAATPTAVLSVYGNQINVRVPQVYFTTNQVTGQVRIDVFTTKGEVFLNTTNMPIDNFLSDFGGDGLAVVRDDEAAFGAISSKLFYFSGVCAGGRGELPFEELRERTIRNANGPNHTPITPAQLMVALEDSGYSIRRYVDNVTTRDLLASKALPASKDPDLITPGSVTIESVVAAMGDLKMSPWVANNGDRLTITPNALWRSDNGVVNLCPASEIETLFDLEADERAQEINSKSYIFSPFYYVLDASRGFNVRPYYLDDPKVIINKFLGDNDTTEMEIEIAAMSVTNTGNGWKLVIETRSNDNWKAQDELYKIAQLSYAPVGIGALAAINGDYMGMNEDGEDIFSFSLVSGYDIDDNHRLSMLNFKAISNDPRETFSDLAQDFRVTFISGAAMPTGAAATEMDNQLVTIDLPMRARAIQAQQINIEFGHYLKNLWAACRTLPASQKWKTYEADVPAVWDEDQFEYNEATNSILWYKGDGTPYTKPGPRRGDPMIIDGKPVMAHHKGTIIYNGGVPVPIDEDNFQRQFSMLFMEGSYFFATDASTTQYVGEITQVLVDYITTGLDGFQERTAERTRVFFYPKVTLGSVTALTDNNSAALIRADQTLIVRLGVQDRVFDNERLRVELTRKTIALIYSYLVNEVVSVSDIIDLLRGIYGSDVISVALSGLGGDLNANVITMINPNERLSLKKRVTVLESGEFTVREAVSVDFFQHGITT